MLRLVFAFALVAAGFGLLRPATCRPEPPRKGRGKDVAREQVVVAPGKFPAKITAKGYGLTLEDAEANAELRAAETIADTLRQQERDLLAVWEDPATQQRFMKYVHHHCGQRTGAQLEDVALEENLPASKVWSLSVTNIDWAGILRAEHEYKAQRTIEQRQMRSRDRQLFAARAMTFVALLLGAFAYLRLELGTRGRYTTAMRAGVAVALTALGVGWLWGS
jgi:hypothetical protein